ncbi:hypothetical protein PVAND_003276 [Polypedilum vanderplanki]|uniref:Lipase domain-containing protein n=1 Tax=Polypedilum vanderplanki TaxID=319348 RepID=A0A9J6BUM4_POLVA|nr:hypothetical protein PVAND_003276 [Polypedilum vanderplanki]
MKFFIFIIFHSVLCLLQVNSLVVDGGINFLFFGSNFSDYVSTTLNYNFTSLQNTKYFNINKPTAVFLHGWGTSFVASVNQALAVAFISRGDYNTIIVDWSKYASDPDYYEVAASINDQATFIVQVLIQMQNAGYNLTSIYFMGHSLGANILGRVGYQLIKNYNFTPTRISGIEPTGVFFGNFNEWPTGISLLFPILNFLNAKFVDIIHTDIYGQGENYPVGHMDFWPNFGHDQPACSINPFYFTCNPWNDNCLNCNHIRSLKYFTESVSSGLVRKFKSRLCNGTNYFTSACYAVVASMGFYADNYANNPGNYFLTTTGVSPYSVSNF